MKKITFIFLLIMCLMLYSCFKSKAESGTIVLLNGTSSAGKTSIIKELQKIYGDTFYVLNLDGFMRTYMTQKPLSQTASPQEVKEYYSVLFDSFYAHARQLSVEGKNVFVDTVEYDDAYEKYTTLLGHGNVIKILMYCPLDVIVDRVAQRNKSGDENEKRSIYQAFAQFPSTYTLQKSADELVIDRIQTSRMKYALQVAEKEVNELLKEAGASQEDSEKSSQFVKDFVQQFKLDTLKEIVLVPKHTWDLIVSCVNSPVDIARTIAEYLKKV